MRTFLFLLAALPLASFADTETSRWQRAIDAAADAGGGCVVVPAGRHVTGGLVLRSNVELHLEKDAVLEGSPRTNDYPVVELPCSEGRWMAVVMAVGATNVAVTGEGEIFGNGRVFPQPANYRNLQEGWRPRGLFFGNCRGVRLNGFRLRDAGSWGCVLQCCADVDIRGLTIDNHANANNDGIDLEAFNAVIADCDIDAGDDAVCLKSNNPDFVSGNVLVTNVTARSHCAALKIGTATHGVVTNVVFVDCRVEAPRRDFPDLRVSSDKPAGAGWFWSDWRAGLYPPSKPGENLGASAISIECVDGGHVENVVCRNITIEGTLSPIFVRGGTRKGRATGAPPGRHHVLRNVLFENITGRSLSWHGNSVTGVEGCRVENVVLRNVKLTFPGGGAAAAAAVKPIPELPSATPGVGMFDLKMPAYALWARHVDGLVLENVSIEPEPGTSDGRERYVFKDVTGLRQSSVALASQCFQRCDGEVRKDRRIVGATVVRADGDPARPRPVGAETAFAVRCGDGRGGLLDSGTVTVWATNCGAEKPLAEETHDLSKGNPFVVRAKLDRPGFLRLYAKGPDGKVASETVPYEPERIRAAEPDPVDFNAYWKGELGRLDETVPLDPRMVPCHRAERVYDGGFDEYEVSFATFCGKRVYGFMTIPKDAVRPLPVQVMVPGAGAGASFTWDPCRDAVTLILNVVEYEQPEDDLEQARRYKALNARVRKSDGVESYAQSGWGGRREDVYFHDAICGIVRGIRWAAAQPFADPNRFVYFGGSQGGGCGMAVVALAGCFSRAFFYITAMSDLVASDAGGRDAWPGVFRLREDPAIRAAVRANAPYYDACNFARRITCPVLVSLGLEDETCPPPNVMASYNALAAAEKRIVYEADVPHDITGGVIQEAYDWLREK